MLSTQNSTNCLWSNTEHRSFNFLAQFPDATGLVGQYAQGNEPSFHIPYLYDFSGQPWKTQHRVRQLMDVWYGDGPLGVPGGRRWRRNFFLVCL